jgi:hypothetical protein
MTRPEALFYEIMWRIEGRGRRLPLPWWVQQYFRAWSDSFDGGLFETREAAFASNALYRYWSMVGVKDRHQECLIGQAGEVEPVYDEYALSFFLFRPATRSAVFPQYPDFSRPQSSVQHDWESGYLPTHRTRWDSPFGYYVEQRVLATVVGQDQKDFALVRILVRAVQDGLSPAWFVLTIAPAGPTGFRRQDKARQSIADRRISSLRYIPADRQVEVNQIWGPTFDTAPDRFGVYGNGGVGAPDPDFYLTFNPVEDLLARGTLNGWDTATDYVGGYCQAAFGWDLTLPTAGDELALDVRLPIGDFRGQGDLQTLRGAPANTLEQAHRAFWTGKLDGSGLQLILPGPVAHLYDLYRICRAALLILSDNGEIHPGPTIYDSFWIRDSSIEGIACALAGDQNLPEEQFGEHYTRSDIFHQDPGFIGPVRRYGFFGGDHEETDLEWDSNGQALWAIGRFDRIKGATYGFGQGLFDPYVIEGARWLRDNRSGFGLLHSGWSAEHLGGKDKPHYWDDLWAIAGLWEAAQLATRVGAQQQANEIWGIYDDVRIKTADSIRWVLDQQRQQGRWETFIPTGPADVGVLDSTIVGALAYFHPCRLYMGAKLGSDIDYAARMTLETIWSHFVLPEGGFRHDTAWGCYGPYLTLQLAHAFLLIGDVGRMDRCLFWAVGNAAYATVHARPGVSSTWQVALGAWNEQHCYRIARDFIGDAPASWYMGDIPHGWAAAEFMLLLRDILFFEADEDNDRHVYIAAGLPPHWLAGSQTVSVRDGPTLFGLPFGYDLEHDAGRRMVTILIRQPLPAGVRYVYPCRLGSVIAADVDGQPARVSGNEVYLPGGSIRARISYA